MKTKWIFIMISIFIFGGLTATGGDFFTEAAIIQSLPFNDTGNTTGLTHTIGYPSNDTFYRINSSVQLTNTTINLSGSSFYTYLHVYDALQNELWSNLFNYEAQATFLTNLTLEANTDYYICIEGYQNNNGAYVLAITADYSGIMVNPPAPMPITNCSPSDMAANVSIGTIFSWDFGANTVTYDLYLDTVYPPIAQVVSGAFAGTQGIYTPQRLQYDTTYYWKVVSHNGNSPFTSTFSSRFNTLAGSNIITIGTGSQIGHNLPVTMQRFVTNTQTIYLPSEINRPDGRIDKVSYQYNMAAPIWFDSYWKIYMGHTTQTNFVSDASYIPLENLTKVFDGYFMSISPEGWLDFILDTQFEYNGIDNLVISVVKYNRYEYSSNPTSSFLGSSVLGNRSIYYITEIEYDGPNEYYQTSVIPNTRLSFCSPIYPNQIVFGVVQASIPCTKEVIFHNSTSDAITINQSPLITGVNASQFRITDTNEYPITLNCEEEISFDISFLLTSEGFKTATLIVFDNQPEGIHEIPLSAFNLCYDSNNISATATEIIPNIYGEEFMIYPALEDDFYVFWQQAPAHIEIHAELDFLRPVNLSGLLFGPYNSIGQYIESSMLVDADSHGWSDNINPYLTYDIVETGYYYLIIRDETFIHIVPANKNEVSSRFANYKLWVTSDNLTPPEGLYPPTNLSSEILYEGISLSWDAPSSTTRALVGYNVYRDKTCINPELITTTSFLDHSVFLTFEQTYAYKVSALYSGPMGESADNDSITVTFIEVDPPIISDSFEEYNDFSSSFGGWITIDGDGENTYGLGNVVAFPGIREPMSFIVFNPYETVPPYPIIPAYSGDKYIACFAADSGENDDWIISPQIQLTDRSSNITFWARSFSTQFGLEELEVAVSYGGTNPEDFSIISGNEPIQIPTEWTRYRFVLNHFYDHTVRLALHSVSNQTIALFVDEIKVRNDGALISNEPTPVISPITELFGNYPNPFNPETTISFSLREQSHVNIEIYNVKGQHLRTLVNDVFDAGIHKIVWNGTDFQDNNVSSGIYFYRMNSSSYTQTGKMILLK
jgi:hypothetical protein